MLLSKIESIAMDINDMIINRGLIETDPVRLNQDVELQRRLDALRNLVRLQSTVDGQYRTVCNNILEHGSDKEDRTGTGTRSYFGQHMVFDISRGKIPLLTTKKVHTRAFIHELLWFLSGETSIKYLKYNNVHIWDSWVDPKTAVYRDLQYPEIMDRLRAHFKTDDIRLNTETPDDRLYTRTESGAVVINVLEEDALREVYRELFKEEPRDLIDGTLHGVYGKQWRRWDHIAQIPVSELGTYRKRGYVKVGSSDRDFDDTIFVRREIDQIKRIVDQLRNDPDSRRIILSPWNVGEIDQMSLPPCHILFQLWTRKLTIDERIEILAHDYTPQAFNAFKGEVSHTDYMVKTGEISEAERVEFMHRVLSDTYQVPERELSGLLFMRSNDMPLGNPFNIGQYGALTHMFAHLTNMTTGNLHWVGGDTHVYNDQTETLVTQLKRRQHDDSARLYFAREVESIDDFIFDDFVITDYEHEPALKYPAAAV